MSKHNDVEMSGRDRSRDELTEPIFSLNAELLGKPTSKAQSGELNRVIVLH